jgi:transposase-like protein
MVARSKRKELAADLRAIFAAPDKSSGLRLAHEAADRWRENHSKVAENQGLRGRR